MLYQDLTIHEPRTTTCVTKDIQYALHSPQNNNALSSNLFIKRIERQWSGGKHRSLRVNLGGTLVHEADRRLLIGTLVCGGMIGFPFLFMLTDCWKHKVFRLVQIDEQIYQAIAKLIEREGTEEVYLTLEDNFFSASKAETLLAGMRNVKNFRFVNTAKGFNTNGHNYTDFRNYMLAFKAIQFLEIRWASSLIFNSLQ